MSKSKSDSEWLLQFALRIASEQHSGNGYEALESTQRQLALSDAVMELSRIATSLHHLSEAACSYELTSRQVKREARLEARAAELVKAFGSGFEAVMGSGDPRGAPLFVKCPSGYSDSWAGLGLVVPY